MSPDTNLAGGTYTRYDQIPPHPLAKGWHTERESPWLFVDGCTQIWEDADFSRLHHHTPTAYCVTAWRPQAEFNEAVDATMDWWRIARTYPKIRIALTAQDILDAKADGGVALVITTQGCDCVGQKLHRMEVLHKLGLRIAIAAYNERNTLCDGVLEPENGGLSKLGRAWVAECNRLGILIDLTHISERATYEMMDLTEAPPVFTHANPRALVDTRRNITDAQMKRVAEKGGVVGVTNWGPINFNGERRPNLDDFLNAVSHVANLIGPDRVSMGTDMSHGTYPDGDVTRTKLRGLTGDRYTQLIDSSTRSKLRYCQGFDDFSHVPDVAEAMMKRGFSKAEVEGILGGNLLRVFRQVWGG